MQLTIKNFRRIRSGTVSLHPKITLIAGPNENGKTSTAQALACLLTGTTQPVTGLLKKHAGQLVHDGATTAQISLDQYTLTFPDGKPTGTRVHIASEYAAGVKPVKEITADELASMIHIHPEYQDLIDEFLDYPESVDADELWKYIEAQGWDAAFTRAKETGSELKGQWRQITNEQYGSKKAESWTPPNYDRTKDESTLTDGIAEAERLYKQAISQRAVADHQRSELQALADDTERALAALAAVEQNMKDTAEALKIAQEAHTPIPTECAVTYDCPQCNTTLVLKSDALEVFTPTAKKPSRAELKKLHAAREQQTEAIRATEKLRDDAITAYREANDYANKCRRARLDLSEATEAPYIDPASALTLLNVLKEKLQALHAYRAAYRIHEKILANQLEQDVLSPAGLRKSVLAERLGGFNQRLRELSAIAEWPAVQLDEIDLIPTSDGRTYKLLSAGAQFRVQVILQIAIALTDKSGYVVIDAADILDRPSRNGLINLLDSINIPSLVTMTYSPEDTVPDLGSIGLGATYWCEGGNLTAVRKSEAVPA